MSLNLNFSPGNDDGDAAKRDLARLERSPHIDSIASGPEKISTP